MCVGLINSFVVLKIRMPSFFATLGSSFIVWGLAIWLLKGQWIYVGEIIPQLKGVLSPSPIFGLSYVFLALLAAYMIGDLLMRTSRLGSIISAVGANRHAASIVGINVTLVKTLCFVFVSLCCGMAGLLSYRLWRYHRRFDRRGMAALGNRNCHHRRRQPARRRREHHRRAARHDFDSSHSDWHGECRRTRQTPNALSSAPS